MLHTKVEFVTRAFLLLNFVQIQDRRLKKYPDVFFCNYFVSLEKCVPHLETDSWERNVSGHSQRQLKLAALSGWLWKGQNWIYSLCTGQRNPQKQTVLTQCNVCITTPGWNEIFHKRRSHHLKLLNIKKYTADVFCFSVFWNLRDSKV